MVLYVIVFVVIIVLIYKLSNVEKENIELLYEKCKNDIYSEYKGKSTKFLNKELSEISKEYHKILNMFVKKFDEDYGFEYITPFGKDEEKIVNGGKSYMRHDKKYMNLYCKYNVICEILEKRNK